MNKFAVEQVLDEVLRIKSGLFSRTDSDVYNAWTDMATDWLEGCAANYLLDGFVGFNDRPPQQIALDFHYAGRLTVPLSDKLVNEFSEFVI